ncbi:hypothetical protein KJ567_02355 [Candidatus Bipolaricaulota bacterium]|nr:hypothetical protein [Candidatus Bipolaricaulota bacterium]
MDTEKRGLAALDAIEARLAKRDRAFLDKDAMCKTYKDVRKYIVDAIDLLNKFPLIGKKITGIVEFLMEIADKVCEVSGE